VPRFKASVPIDDYVLDVLMRDLIGHDQKAAAYLVYLHLYGQSVRKEWRPVAASLRTLAESTGLSKSAIHTALAHLRRRKLIVSTRGRATATSRHHILRHWRK
jgi:DNA-binding GntR family transcriptional regulator